MDIIIGIIVVLIILGMADDEKRGVIAEGVL